MFPNTSYMYTIVYTAQSDAKMPQKHTIYLIKDGLPKLTASYVFVISFSFK